MALSAPVTIAGNLTADPELRHTSNGKPVASFTVAHTPSVYNQQTKQFQDGETLFLRCSVWDNMAEHLAHSLRKGDRVILHGQMKSKTYQDRDGNKKTGIEVTVDEVGASLKFSGVTVAKGNGHRAQTSEPADNGWQVSDDETPF